MGVSDFELAREIAGAMRRLYAQGLTTTSGGNISVRRGDEVFMTPGGTDKARMETAQIGRLSMAGTVLDPGFKPTCEAGLHLAVYRVRPDVTAIVHAHPVTASAFAASTAEISTHLLYESAAVLGCIGRVRSIPFGTPELAAAAAETAKEFDVFLLNNHGAMALGSSLLQAFDRLEVLENAARTTLICEHLLKAPPLPPIRI